MRKSFAVVLVLLLSALTGFSVQQPTANWITYASPEGRYRVSLPAQPKVQTQESTAATGEKFPQYLASVSEADGVVFMVGFFDVLPGTLFSTDGARDAMVKSVTGKLLAESAITLGAYPGRELNIALNLPAGAAGAEVEYVDRARIFEADKRVYILQAIFPKALEGEALSARTNKYFASFELLKN